MAESPLLGLFRLAVGVIALAAVIGLLLVLLRKGSRWAGQPRPKTERWLVGALLSLCVAFHLFLLLRRRFPGAR